MEPILVKYRNETFDISSFIHKHPGGMNTLKGLENSDITSRILKDPPHSEAAMHLMNEYKVYDSSFVNNNNEGEQIQADSNMEVSMLLFRSYLKDLKRACYVKLRKSPREDVV